MATMRTGRLGTCQPDKSHCFLDSDWQMLEQERRFTGVCRHLGQTPSDLCQELLGADTHGFKCSQCHWKKVVGAAEWAVLVLFWQLQSQRHWHWWWHSAAESVSQSVNHCDVPSGAAPGVPWQQRQTVVKSTTLHYTAHTVIA